MAQASTNHDSADSSSTALPAAKRRRVDDAARALAKPFRSPFKSPLAHPLGGHGNTEHEKFDSSELPVKHGCAGAGEPSSYHSPAFSTPKPAKPLHSSCLPTATHPALDSDPVTTPLLRTQRALESSVRNARTDIDTLSQALKIARSGRDAELEELIAKWRVASRTAAEEVFAKVRDRVNRMGGVGSWREREKKQEEWRREWDNEGRGQDKQEDGGDGEEDDEDEDGEGKTRETSRRETSIEEYDMDDRTIEQAPNVDEGREDDVRAVSWSKGLGLLTRIDVHDGHDVAEPEHRAWRNRL